MTNRAFDKRCIALEQLETALRLFIDSGEYFSVITLAGAAEEIFGKILEKRGRRNTATEIGDSAAIIFKIMFGEDIKPNTFIDRANRARNAIKHLESGGYPTITMDPRNEAIDILNRAIDNYYRVEESLTDIMRAYLEKYGAA